jgi:hypothetical protein
MKMIQRKKMKKIMKLMVEMEQLKMAKEVTNKNLKM